MLQDCQKITFICDPLLSEYGPLRPAILIARKIVEKHKHVMMVSTTISSDVQVKLRSMNIQAHSLMKEPLLKKNESIAWLEQWIKEAMFSMNSRGLNDLDGILLNFSNTLCIPAHVWYAQGPPTITLDNMKRSLPLHYRMTYQIISPVLKIFDGSFTKRISSDSNCVVANSKYLGQIYRDLGVHPTHIINPPLDCEQFCPKTPTPSGDFVLTYFGKETVFSVIKQVLDMGLRVKAFGGKLSMVPKRILRHPNLVFLGRIDDDELIDLYSNALFTLYPFTDEPFGYIPIESLACGTPVMTFNKQGPRETILNRETGWLANDDSELAKLASEIWKKGYPKAVRKSCRERALRYDVNVIVDEWTELLSEL